MDNWIPVASMLRRRRRRRQQKVLEFYHIFKTSVVPSLPSHSKSDQIPLIVYSTDRMGFGGSKRASTCPHRQDDNTRNSTSSLGSPDGVHTHATIRGKLRPSHRLSGLERKTFASFWQREHTIRRLYGSTRSNQALQFIVICILLPSL